MVKIQNSAGCFNLRVFVNCRIQGPYILASTQPCALELTKSPGSKLPTLFNLSCMICSQNSLVIHNVVEAHATFFNIRR